VIWGPTVAIGETPTRRELRAPFRSHPMYRRREVYAQWVALPYVERFGQPMADLRATLDRLLSGRLADVPMQTEAGAAVEWVEGQR